MGLDMTLEGDVYFYDLTPEQLKKQPVHQTYQFGRWYQRFRLHDYVTSEISLNDDRSEIPLAEAELRQIIAEIKENAPDSRMVRYFDPSKQDGLEKAETIGAFEAAISWLHSAKSDEIRCVYYRASW